MDAQAAADTELFDVLSKHRFKALDGLRGIASLGVGVTHALSIAIAVTGAAYGGYMTRLAGISNGAGAVDLFFIMSGFFLAGMLENQPNNALSVFYVRRLVRLVPPATISVLIMYVYDHLAAEPVPGHEPFFMQFETFNYAIPVKELLLNICLIRHGMNPPLWTIRIELGASFIFPLIIFLKNHSKSRFYRLLMFLVLFAVAFLARRDQKLGIDVVHYLYIFYAGVLIRDFGSAARHWPRQIQTWLLALSVIGIILTGEFVPTLNGHPVLFDTITTCFGALLVLLLSHGTLGHVQAFMNGVIVQFLGRISYSFYLINCLAVEAVGSIAAHFTKLGHEDVLAVDLCIVLGSVGVGLLLACLLHAGAEKPAVGLSRYLGDRRLRLKAH